MWTDRWERNKHRGRDGIGPLHWWRSDHSSGYSVGEVDAGHYVACTPSGAGVTSADGDYLSFPSQDAAKEHVDQLIETERQLSAGLDTLASRS